MHGVWVVSSFIITATAAFPWFSSAEARAIMKCFFFSQYSVVCGWRADVKAAASHIPSYHNSTDVLDNLPSFFYQISLNFVAPHLLLTKFRYTSILFNYKSSRGTLPTAVLFQAQIDRKKSPRFFVVRISDLNGSIYRELSDTSVAALSIWLSLKALQFVTFLVTTNNVKAPQTASQRSITNN